MIRSCLTGDVAPGQIRPADLDLARRELVRAVIRRHIGSARLDGEMISTLSGLPRTTLYRMFASHGGVANYLRELRLRRIYEDLGDPALAGRTIAERWGFHNAASFSRVFRSAFGCSPGDVRAAAYGGLRLVPPSSFHPPDDGLGFAGLLK